MEGDKTLRTAAGSLGSRDSSWPVETTIRTAIDSEGREKGEIAVQANDSELRIIHLPSSSRSMHANLLRWRQDSVGSFRSGSHCERDMAREMVRDETSKEEPITSV